MTNASSAMKRTARSPLYAALITSVAAGALVVIPLLTQPAAAATANGYASQNGGTTGGTGGATVTASSGTAINQALCGRASASTPIIIQVSGTISLSNTSQVSSSTKACSTASDAIELKYVSNVTLIGSGSALFDGIGIHVRGSHNIIIQNVAVRNVKKSNGATSNGGDAIGMESDVSNVWVDHNSLSASGGEDEGYDSLLDMKAGTKYVTVSYNTFSNSGRGGLVGSSDSDTGNGPVTFHHNYYNNIDSRTPLLRAATGHMYDNYYVSLNKSGINSRDGGKARVENNYFKNSKDVLGTFYSDLMGTWQASGNIFDNVTWTADGEENHPAGPNVTSTGSVSVPYSYSLDAASCVPSIVPATAGAGKGLATSNGSCSGGGTSSSSSTTTTSKVTTTTSRSSGTSTTTRSTSTTRTSSTTGAGSGGLTCSASTSGWSGGFVTNVTVSNGTSSAVNGWTVKLGYNQSVSITGSWSATVSASGSAVSATPVSYNTTVGANGSQSFGFQGTSSGTIANPSCSVS
jgi:pectate lyase